MAASAESRKQLKKAMWVNENVDDKYNSKQSQSTKIS